MPLSSYPAIIEALNQFCGAIFSAAIKCAEGLDTYVLTSHPPSGSLLQLRQNPCFPNKRSQGQCGILSLLFAWQYKLSRGKPPLQYPPPPFYKRFHLSLAPLCTMDEQRAKFRPLLPRIEQTCIPKRITHRQNTDLVRCLLEACTSISVLLNSFSSFRIAACRA